MTAKGQVTIPQEPCECFGLRARAEIEVVDRGDDALVRALTPGSRGDELLARLRDRADGGLDAEAVLELTRKPPSCRC